MPSLQRSCQACITAKRRCDLSTPCSRCDKKGVECRYVNSPGGSDPSETEASCCSPIERPDKEFSPEVTRSYDVGTLDHLKGLLLGCVEDFTADKSTVFIHPSLRDEEPLTEPWSICAEYLARSQNPEVLQQAATRFIGLANQQTDYLSLLSHVQAAITLSIPPLLLSAPDSLPIDTKALWAVTHRLWEEAPSHISSRLSRWEEWVRAESMRRTILACNIMLRTWMVMKQGYATQSLCIEALPFDGGLGLWDARGEVEWEHLVEKMGKGELVSVAEFVKMKGDEKGSSRFEELILLAFKDAARHEYIDSKS